MVRRRRAEGRTQGRKKKLIGCRGSVGTDYNSERMQTATLHMVRWTTRKLMDTASSHPVFSLHPAYRSRLGAEAAGCQQGKSPRERWRRGLA